LKVLLYAESVDATRGGLETAVSQLAGELVKKGYETHVAAASAGTPIAGLRYHLLPRRERPRVRALEALRAALKPDITHAVLPCATADIYQPHGGLVPEIVDRNLALAGGPLARWWRGATLRMNAKRRYRARLEACLLRPHGQTVVAAISRYVAGQCERHYGLGGQRVRLVFNGVPLKPQDAAWRVAQRESLRRQWEVPSYAALGLFVAHQFRLKGLDLLLQAVAQGQAAFRGQNSGLRVLIVGRGRQQAYRRRSERLGCGDLLRFSGVSTDMAALYAAADFLVLPTYYDPCSLVSLEAMAAGLPVITTGYNGAAELIEHGVNGFVLDGPTDLAGLQAAMAALCDADRRQAIADKLPGEEALSLDRHVRQMVELYEEVAARRSRGTC